eukprot:1685630-Alexandrium_andersonii.AAC.1
MLRTPPHSGSPPPLNPLDEHAAARRNLPGCRPHSISRAPLSLRAHQAVSSFRTRPTAAVR